MYMYILIRKTLKKYYWSIQINYKYLPILSVPPFFLTISRVGLSPTHLMTSPIFDASTSASRPSQKSKSSKTSLASVTEKWRLLKKIQWRILKDFSNQVLPLADTYVLLLSSYLDHVTTSLTPFPLISVFIVYFFYFIFFSFYNWKSMSASEICKFFISVALSI